MGHHNLEAGFKAREKERISLKTLSSPPTLSFGREMAEVLSISYKGRGDPSWTIIVYDGKRGQIIYTRGSRQADKRASLRPSNSGTQNANNHWPLPLTGPYRVISLDGCFVLEYNIDDRCHDEILLDIDHPSTKYNEAVTEELGCTCNNHPRAVVTYALLSNAVEAIVEVKLHQQRDNTFYGRIIARSYLGEVVLFESNYENMLIGSSQEPTIIPLARSVLAVPLDSSLQIEVDLHDQSNGKIVKGHATCQADVNSNHVLRLNGEDGQVDVKITWSD